jgi:hypothetical protein
VRVTRGTGGAWLLTITAHPGSRPKNVQLSLVWVLRHGGHVVSEHEQARPAGRLPRTITRTFPTGSLGAGRYTFTGTLVAERGHGVAQQARDPQASRGFQVG